MMSRFFLPLLLLFNFNFFQAQENLSQANYSSDFFSGSFSTVEILFIEKDDSRGQLVQLELHGRFYHLALRVQNASGDQEWFHAHPWRGSELASSKVIRTMGDRFYLARLQWPSRVTRAEVTPWLGRPFDREFVWDDEKLYCSELIAKILGLEPEPMIFHTSLWPDEYLSLNGLPGISPDGVFRRLQPFMLSFSKIEL
jgi:hypothetical protein